MADEKILLVIQNEQLVKLLKDSTLTPAGYQVTSIDEQEKAQSVLLSEQFDVVILDDGKSVESTLGFSQELLINYPALAIIVLSESDELDLIRTAFGLGITDFLTLPLKPNDVLDAVRVSLERRNNLISWVHKQTRRDTASLRRHVDEFKELEKIGRSVTASLDLDHVLMVIVDAAVVLTGADEGSLLILDEPSGELFMRAARNFQDEFVRTFRLPVDDTLAGDVIRNGVPVMINEDTPHKIKTKYLVHTLMYVPLQVQEKVIGVLGVDHRASGQSFTQKHLSLVSTLADYAAIAIENARLYHSTELERYKLDSILTQIEDGVVVVSTDNRIILANRTFRLMFDLADEDIVGEQIDSVIKLEPLSDIVVANISDLPYKREIILDDGYILNAQFVKIPDVGLAVTIHDITYFKELDRIKTEFVNTVSHDLRSPLTAILGYVELITRVGEINDQQREFIKRVQISVRNITELINDLLELGRIEAGFDTRKEFVPLGVIVQYAIESIQTRLAERNHKLTTDISNNIPDLFGDPVRLRQVVDNLLNNALRYTPDEGKITVSLTSQTDQVILQVQDTGWGIPLKDQPYIFEKFYRASNIPENNPGSGLGLAIVKSIVENHQGRVWVESKEGEGTVFTVVLPIPEQSSNHS